jgi:hypothetical protein
MSAANRRIERLRQPDDFRKVFALATATALTLLTVVVVSRRMSGAFRGPMSPAVPCLVATLSALLSVAALALGTTATRSIRKRILSAALALLPPAALGAALWVSPSAFVGGYLAALVAGSTLCAVAIEDRAAGSRLANSLSSSLFQSPTSASQNSGRPTTNPHDSGSTGGLPASVHSRGVEEPQRRTSRDSTEFAEVQCDSKEAPAVDLPSQEEWMTRRRLPDGGEMIEGAVRIDLDPAESVGVAHLSFVPPLACDPKAECHLLCDFGGRVRITAAKSYGLRIEARQSGELTLATTINVAFSAQAPPAASRAAAA